ncbi:MAG: sulfotransferase [Anaerolineales bacterium]|nr:sulfotransferase [Anaerolineales bacterium]MCW5854409.1 sulfotransferase [Anaerolineales bacterium]
MPINLSLLFQLTFQQFFKSQQDQLKLSARRRGAMLLWYLVIPVHQLLTLICYYLDEIFFPAYRQQEIKAPVFIVGNFRSGSTLLQRLLAKDDQFTSMNVAEIYIAPTITQRKFWGVLDFLDRTLLGGRGRRYLMTRDRRWLDSIQMHKVGLFTPDEDEGLLITIWATMFLQFVFPVDNLPPYDRFDEEIPAQERQRIMGFYRAIIRRHLYCTGGDKIYLAKSPAHTGRIESLREFFPDARIIYLARDPLELVPSALSFFEYIWDYMGLPDAAKRMQAAMLEQIRYWYLYPMERFRHMPHDSYFILYYNDLIADIPAAVDALYQWMRSSLSDAFRVEVEQTVVEHLEFRSDNVYTLEGQGLSSEQIAKEFAEVYQLFQFERHAELIPVAH